MSHVTSRTWVSRSLPAPSRSGQRDGLFGAAGTLCGLQRPRVSAVRAIGTSVAMFLAGRAVTGTSTRYRRFRCKRWTVNPTRTEPKTNPDTAPTMTLPQRDCPIAVAAMKEPKRPPLSRPERTGCRAVLSCLASCLGVRPLNQSHALGTAASMPCPYGRYPPRRAGRFASGPGRRTRKADVPLATVTRRGTSTPTAPDVCASDGRVRDRRTPRRQSSLQR